MRYKAQNVKKPGSIPGTLIYTGKNHNENFSFEIFKYNSKEVFEEIDTDLTTIKFNDDKDYSYWINIVGICETDKIKFVSVLLNLDNLTIEDILNVNQRPKVEFYDNYFYTVLRMCFLKENNIIQNEQLSIIIKENLVITFQETKADIFNPLRERIRNANSTLRKSKIDYLLYVILDIIIDNYLHILEFKSDEIDKVDELVSLGNTKSETAMQVYSLREDISLFRKQLSPVKEIINSIQKVEGKFMKKQTLKYFRDLYDHSLVVGETLEEYRETLSDLLGLYHTKVNNKMNETMKVLTLIATIFIPLSFIVGIYGMNFQYMPELHWRYGYLMVWGIILSVSFTMVYYFKKKDWI